MKNLVCKAQVAVGRPLPSESIAKGFGWLSNGTPHYAASIALTILFLVADLLMPRGATPAIGYCVVLIVAAEARREWFLLGMAVVCSLLTWVGYFLEPAGAAWWMSVFDRAMVTMVVWSTFFLVNRRIKALVALAHQTLALQLATKELERSNEELGSFASVIAHDLRSPLNTIGLFTQMVDDRRTQTSADEKYESLDSIQHEITRMSALIQRLLTYGRVGSGEIQPEACDCEAVLASVLRNLTSELQQVAGVVTHDSLPIVAADPTLVAALFQNLIENSLKYRGDAPPKVHIAASKSATGYQFSICDNGIGFQTEDATRIFQPFQQAHRAHPRHGGIGLGLATCKKIVERHHGRIWAESRPGHGSTFYFTLPQRTAVPTNVQAIE
ncbi:MAG TPA: ATP-binding protein [Candidatus Dormibacteraeota bacterium]|nr:ATP-binding protein [Candidatus Dormibacteraeota bacterium]